MRSFKIFTLSLILIGMITVSFALESTLTFKGGVSQAETDIYQDKEINGMIGLSYEIWMTKWLSLGLHPYVTRVQAGTDDDPETTDIIEQGFQSDVVGGDLLFKIRPFSIYIKDAAINRIAPFGVVGAGAVNYYQKDLDQNPLPPDPDPIIEDYPYTGIVAPAFGGGLTFFTKYDIDFDFSFQKNIMMSDYLEGWEKGDFDDSYWMAFLGVSHTFGKHMMEKPQPKPVELKPEPMLMVSQNEQKLPYQAGSRGFDIAANLPWSAQASDSWFTISPLSGTGDSPITINYEANKSINSRTGKILITGGNFNRIINVYQDAMQIKLLVTPSVYQVNNAAGRAYFAVEANTAWTATEDTEWFTIAPVSGNGNGEIVVIYKENPVPKIRVGQIYVSAGEDNQTLSITQDRSAPAPIPEKQPMILEGVNFRSGSSDLTEESYPVLDEAAASLAYYSEVEVEIQGHTDSTGSLKLNKQLSLDRAITVKAYLISKGIADNRMTVKGFGPDNPIAPNDTADGRAKNRRIEFVRTN